jgi:hypothetical protein
MSCQHLQFCQTKSDSTYPLAIFNYASVKLVGRYVDYKVKIYAGYLHILRTIHDCKWIADLYSRQSPEYEMKNPLKNRGQWLSLFYLTLSDISADMW